MPTTYYQVSKSRQIIQPTLCVFYGWGSHHRFGNDDSLIDGETTSVTVKTQAEFPKSVTVIVNVNVNVNLESHVRANKNGPLQVAVLLRSCLQLLLVRELNSW